MDYPPITEQEWHDMADECIRAAQGLSRHDLGDGYWVNCTTRLLNEVRRPRASAPHPAAPASAPAPDPDS